MASKFFYNNTDFELQVILYTRDESTSQPGALRNGNTTKFTLAPREQRKQVTFEGQHLNAINYNWIDENVKQVEEQETLAVGTWWDNIVNGYASLYFNKIDTRGGGACVYIAPS